MLNSSLTTVDSASAVCCWRVDELGQSISHAVSQSVSQFGLLMANVAAPASVAIKEH